MINRIFSIVITSLLLGSCTPANIKQPSEATAIDTTHSTSCPYLAKTAEGRILMSWVKELNDTDAVMCFTAFDGKTTEGTTIYEIPASKGVHPHGENLPKIAAKRDGTLIAMWGVANPNPNNKHSGLVFYAVSVDGGKDWSEAIPLVADTSSYDQRYYDMELLPSGEIAVVWLDSRLKGGQEGSTMFYAVTDSTNRFAGEKPVAETCCPCCRTDLFIDRKGTIHIAFRDIIDDSIRDMTHVVSTNNGQTFSTPVRISPDNWVIDGCPHTGPTIAENTNGFHFAWYTMGSGNGVFYNHSTDGAKTFSVKESLSPEASAKHPQILAADNNNIFIAWDQVARLSNDANNIVVLQQRSADGALMRIDTVSKTSEVANFPVLKETSEGSLLIAYTVQRGDGKTVYYKLLPTK